MKSGIGWLLLGLPKDAAKGAGGWLSQINSQWLGIAALLAAMAVGAGATAWWYEQPRPEDLDELQTTIDTMRQQQSDKLDALLDRQDAVVQDVRHLRRSVCRLEGNPSAQCELRVRQDDERYEFDLESEWHPQGAPSDILPDPITRRRR